MILRAWVGAVGDGQSGGLGDRAAHHLNRVLVELKDMRRGRVCGDGGGRYGGRFDIETGGRDHVNELAARTGGELHRGCRLGAGEHQAGLRR